jgi:hypothetical protein
MKITSKSFYSVLFCVTFYFAVIFILQLFVGWYQNFSDATHYLWIADKYAEGDSTNSINTYWGPLISWLLFLMDVFFTNPYIKFRVLQVVLGAFTVVLFYLLINKKTSNKKISLLSTIVFIPAVCTYVWFYHTPDLLLLFLTLLLLFNVNELFINKNKKLILLALIGACMYFTKSVGLFFFILLFVVKFFFEDNKLKQENYSRYIKLAFFLILFISPWVILISVKNKGFTLGTGSAHNYNMNSPRITPDIYGELGNPYHLGQLTEPVPANAFDACIEHMHQDYPAWEGYSLKEKIKIYFKIIFKNCLSARSMFFGLDTGLIFLILLVAGFFSNKQIAVKTLRDEKELIIIFLANVALYLPFFFMERYTWPGSTALFILSILLFFKLIKTENNLIRNLFFSLILLLNSFLVIKEIKYAQPEKPIISELWKTNGELKINRTIWLCKKEDKRLGLVKGVIYYNHGQYLGALFSDEKNNEKIREELIKFKINQIITLEPLNENFKRELGLKKLIYNSNSLNIYKFSVAEINL